MKKLILLATTALCFASGALAQAPTRQVGPLQIQNNFSEIVANATQTAARNNLGIGPAQAVTFGAVTANGALSVAGNITMTGTLVGPAGGFLPLIGGALSGSLQGTSASFPTGLSAGTTTITGNQTVSGNSTIGGILTAGNLTTPGSLGAGSALFTGTLTTGATTVNGNLTVNGTITGSGGSFLPLAGGTLTGGLTGTSLALSGAISAASAALTGNATIGGTLGVTGATTLTGGAMTGTYTGAHTYSGAVTLSAAGTGLIVTNNATIGGVQTIGIAGQSTLTLTPGVTTSVAPIIATNSTAGIQLAGGSAGVNIVGGGPLVSNNGVSITRALAPAGVLLNPLSTWTVNLSGTATNTANTSVYQYNGSDSLAIPSGFVNYWTMNYSFGGAGMVGNRKAMHVVSAQSSQSGNFAAGFETPGGPFYQAVLFAQQISANEGGTSTNQNTSYGQAFAGSSTIKTFPGSTFFHGVSNWEFDMNVSEASYSKTGISLVQLPTDVAQGVLDGAIVIANGGTSANNGWHNGFVAISPNTNFPYAADGWLFNAPLAADFATFNTMKGGFNLEPIFTRAAILSRNFSLDGLGTVQVGNGYLTMTPTGVSLDASGSVGPAEGSTLSGAAIVSGGTGYVGGLSLHDPYGGSWVVTAGPGGVITVLTCIRTPYFNSVTPPANPVTLTPGLAVLGTVGGTVSVNIPWTQPNVVTLGGIGTVTAATAAVDTSTLQLATTGFVLNQAATALPLTAGTAAAGTSTRYARADHVHPTDVTRAPLASPTFTGTIGGAAMALTGNATIGGTLGVTGATTLAGGTMTGTYAGVHTNSGAVTFSAAGTGLAVTNNATIGGTLGVTGALTGTSETLTGNFTGTTATLSGILTEGGNAVANPALILNGDGTGQIGIRFQVAGANRWRWISTDAETGNNTGSDMILQSYTDAGAATSLTKITRSTGLFQHNSNMLVNKTVTDNSNQTGLIGQLTLTSQGEFGTHIGGALQASNVGYVSNLDPAWATGVSYSIGNVVNVSGSLLTATSAGVSGVTTPSCTTTVTTCSDGTVSWSYLGGVGVAYQLVGGFASANMTNSFGGAVGAPIGGVFGLNTQANVRVANGVFVIGYELNYGAAFPVLNRVGLQIVGGTTGVSQGTQTDVGLRFEGQPGFAPLRHMIDIGGNTGSDILDPNGYVMRVFSEGYNQGAGPPIPMAGAGGIDFLEFTASGTGEAGGGFILRGPGSQILTSGDVQSNFALLHQTATGASLDVSQYHVTSAAVHSGGGGTGWSTFKWFATCSDGSIIKVTSGSGGAVTGVSLVLGAYVNAASSTVTCTSEQVAGFADNAGNPILSSTIQVDMTAVLANSGSPVLALGGTALVTAATASVDTSTLQLATTGFVLGQAASALPLTAGTAAAGTSTRYARADHVHPTDTTRYAASNPSGFQTAAQVTASITAAAYTLPAATASVLGGVKPDGTTILNTAGAISVAYGSSTSTAAQGNDARITGALSTTTAASTYQPLLGFTPYNSTNPSGFQTAAQVTAVLPVASSTLPLAAGTAAIGTGTTWARADHVHPTDVTRAPLASPTFTGVPLSTTAAVDTNTTQIATTAFVLAQAASATPLIDGTAAVGTSTRYARGDHVHPTDTTRAPVASPTFTGTVTIPSGASISGFAPLASPTFTGTVNAANIVATGSVTGQAGVIAGTNTNAQPLSINGQAGANRNLIWQTAGVKRFQINITSTAEAGANVGSDVAMSVSDDTGATIFTPISIIRSTGLTTMNNLTATIVGGTINSSVIGGTTPLAGTFTTATATTYKVGANQVVAARDTGWTAMTGSTDKATAFATSTVTLAQLAGRVMAMQTALTTHGLLGP